MDWLSALAPGTRLGVRIEASWPVVDGRIDGWWGQCPSIGDAAGLHQSNGPQPLWLITRRFRTAKLKCCLTKPSFLSRGTPWLCSDDADRLCARSCFPTHFAMRLR